MDKINQWKFKLDVLKTIISKKELTETVKWGSTV